MTDFLKFPPRISDIQQVLSDHMMKCTVKYCLTKLFFIGKSDWSDSFQELCYDLYTFPSLGSNLILR